MKLPLKVNGRDITVETSESVMLVDVLHRIATGDLPVPS